MRKGRSRLRLYPSPFSSASEKHHHSAKSLEAGDKPVERPGKRNDLNHIGTASHGYRKLRITADRLAEQIKVMDQRPSFQIVLITPDMKSTSCHD